LTLPIIEVDRLTKLYRIGSAAQQRRDTLIGTIGAWVMSPVRNFQALRDLSEFGDATSANIVRALDDVSFEVAAGEVVGIVGRNGAGKSTLLKILSRITEPTSGSARIRGRVASLLEVGTGFHTELTGRENVYLNGTILGMSRREINEKFSEIVEFSGVSRFIDTPVKRYSSGMQVRLAFAVAAHLEPEVLIIDEVLAVGDAEFQAKCLGKMRDISRAHGRTVLFVSHNTGAVRQLCSRSMWIDRGKLVVSGDTPAVIDQYLRSGAQVERVASWPAGEGPSGGEVELRGIAVRGGNGDTESSLTTADEICVDIDYVLTTQIEKLRVMFTLLAADGTEIFMTSDYDAQPVSRVRSAGRYVSRCRIPANFLNSGTYIVAIDFEIPKVRSLLADVRVNFTVPELSTNQLYRTHAARPPGVIHPVLPWSVEQVDASMALESDD
jgi:lipopolysaccharide transport system ATP-binding protein